MLEGDDDPLNHGVVQAAAATRAMWQEDHRTARDGAARGLEIVGSRGDDQQLVALYALGLRIEADEAERLRARRLPVTADGRARLRRRRCTSRCGGCGRRWVTASSSFPEAALEVATADAEFDRLRDSGSAARWRRIADGWDRLARPYPAAVCPMAGRRAAGRGAGSAGRRGAAACARDHRDLAGQRAPGGDRGAGPPGAGRSGCRSGRARAGPRPIPSTSPIGSCRCCACS